MFDAGPYFQETEQTFNSFPDSSCLDWALRVVKMDAREFNISSV
jgi:hypothetical protein